MILLCFFRAGEEMKQKMVELSRTNRIVETQLSELTAESARNLTSASQLKRNHQITINQLEDDHQNEIQKHRLGIDHTIEHFSVISARIFYFRARFNYSRHGNDQGGMGKKSSSCRKEFSFTLERNR